MPFDQKECLQISHLRGFFRQRVLIWQNFPGSPKTKLGYQHTPILATTLRESFFKELKRLGSIRSEATRKLIDDLTFLFSGSSLFPLQICWGELARVGIPHLKIKRVPVVLQERACGGDKQCEEKNRHTSHNSTY